MNRWGIIGNEQEKNLIMALHEAGQQESDSVVDYMPLKITPEYLTDFLKIDGSLFNGFLVGSSMAHLVLPSLNALSDLSLKTGRVNLIYADQDKWIGTDTKPLALAQALETRLGELAERPVLIAGETTEDLVIETALEPAGVKLFSWKNGSAKAHALNELNSEMMRHFEAIVALDQRVLTAEMLTELHSGQVVLDLGTKGLESDLILAAEEADCQLLFHDEILALQAQIQFEMIHTERIALEFFESALYV